MYEPPHRQRDDIPLPVALVLLCAVVLFTFVSPDMKTAIASLHVVEIFMKENETFLVLTSVFAVINGIAIFELIARAKKYRKQGAKLRDLVGDKIVNRKVVGIPVSMFSVIFVTLYAANMVVRAFAGIAFIPVIFSKPLIVVSVLNATVALTIFCEIVRRLIKKITTKTKAITRQVFPPAMKPTEVMLGTKPGAATPEEWVVMGPRGLAGNLLITGSIGSGKTQGTILPYFSQMLQNKELPPAVLAVDPKGTFVKEAMKIAESAGRKNDILHITLAGSVTFNPVYVDNVLKSGRFLDVTQMIRAAAINFSGKSGADSPFWELSAFNLTKNAVIYCAVVSGYYTLVDIYKAMVAAADGGVTEKLEVAIKNKKLEPEEEFNARQAMTYFSDEFAKFDSKLKTGILATATSFLNQFQEFSAAKLFCPPEDKRTIKSMDEVIDSGKVLCFDIDSPGLAKTLGTFCKLHYQQSILRRLTDPSRTKERQALLIIDEYQEVVSSGHGNAIGDDRFLAKAREANAVTIVATQSLSSIENSLGSSNAAKELYQNFRTRIALHSADLFTINTFKELVGEEDRAKKTHSFSELSQDPQKKFMEGGFVSDKANISESVSTSLHRESIISGKDFSNLKSFEALALVFDGKETSFTRLYLKPHFLKNKNTSHADILKGISNLAVLFGLLFQVVLGSTPSLAVPNVCDVVNSETFSSCLEYSVGTCTCGYPPRPCASFSYYVPDTYVEVTSEKGVSAFRGLPGVEAQLSVTTAARAVPYGSEGDDFSAFQARTITVPFSGFGFSGMACQGSYGNATCFGAMSEHLGQQWNTGLADSRQPNFLAWIASPKACLAYGAARSVVGGGEMTAGGNSGTCSTPKDWLLMYPPSGHSACNGWGAFYPRVGHYDGPSTTTAALMVASRMKSISAEVFHSAPGNSDEKWQMILPSVTGCFREGQNLSILEAAKLLNERGRLQGKLKDYLFVTWHRVSCCRDVHMIPVSSAALVGLKASCTTLGGIH